MVCGFPFYFEFFSDVTVILKKNLPFHNQTELIVVKDLFFGLSGVEIEHRQTGISSACLQAIGRKLTLQLQLLFVDVKSHPKTIWSGFFFYFLME